METIMDLPNNTPKVAIQWIGRLQEENDKLKEYGDEFEGQRNFDSADSVAEYIDEQGIEIEKLEEENEKLKKENEQFKILNRIIGNNWDYFKEDFEKWEKELIECGFSTSEDFE
jgi:predicted RNase H-like nuclease (RuvC/YqgF family)